MTIGVVNVEEVKILSQERRTQGGGCATASFARTRFGSLKVSAPLRTWSTLQQEKPLGRLQHLISPNQDGSHPMHRATKECVSSSGVRIEA